MSEAYVITETVNQFGTPFWDVALRSPYLLGQLPAVSPDPVGKFERVVENPYDFKAWSRWMFEFRHRVGGHTLLAYILSSRLDYLRYKGQPLYYSRTRFFLEIPCPVNEGDEVQRVLLLNIDPDRAFEMRSVADEKGEVTFVRRLTPKEALIESVERRAQHYQFAA